MASVNIDMGSGKRATLTCAKGSAGMCPSVSQRSGVSELMLHWPKYAGLMTGAVGPGVAALPVDKPLPSWATPSDVSADELMSYLQSVVAGTSSTVADTAAGLTDSAPLGDAAPFEYTGNALGGDVEQLAASTNNPNFAVKMLGYGRDTFGDMIHSMKDDLNLGGADNVIWHDNGDVEFKKQIIGNMHDYK